MLDNEREKIVKMATAYRKASRAEGLPEDEAKRLRDAKSEIAMRLLDDPIGTLQWAIEEDLHNKRRDIHMALRSAISGYRHRNSDKGDGAW